MIPRSQPPKATLLTSASRRRTAARARPATMRDGSATANRCAADWLVFTSLLSHPCIAHGPTHCFLLFVQGRTCSRCLAQNIAEQVRGDLMCSPRSRVRVEPSKRIVCVKPSLMRRSAAIALSSGASVANLTRRLLPLLRPRTLFNRGFLLEFRLSSRAHERFCGCGLQAARAAVRRCALLRDSRAHAVVGGSYVSLSYFARRLLVCFGYRVQPGCSIGAK